MPMTEVSITLMDSIVASVFMTHNLLTHLLFDESYLMMRSE
jgi:hypothetical protein